jgi:hypothetical protein
VLEDEKKDYDAFETLAVQITMSKDHEASENELMIRAGGRHDLIMADKVL